MVSFYTNVDRYGQNLLYRGYENGKQVSKKIKFEPTFWIPGKSDDSFRTLTGIEVSEIKPGSMRDSKDFIEKYKDVANFNVYGTTNYIHQFLSETYPRKVNFDPKKICTRFLDIEVASADGFPHPEEARHEIIAITIKDSNKSQYHAWGLQPFDVSKVDKPVLYRHCSSEYDLLGNFLDYWVDHYPDVITGWYSELFDMPYIVNRMWQVLGEDATKRLSPWNMIERETVYIAEKPRLKVNLVGITQLDYIDLFKKFTKNTLGEQDSYKLNDIAHVVLEERKIDYSEYGHLHVLYEKNFQKFLEYNIQDVVLVEKIDAKLGLLLLVFTLAYKAKCTFKETLGTVGIWDAFLYNVFKTKKMALPFSLGSVWRNIEGGYVKDPQIGLHKWVISLDLNSLYPRLIAMYNMSPETTLPKNTHLTVDEILDALKSNTPLRHRENVCVTATGQSFRTDFKGVLPEVVDALYDERVEIKRQMIEKKRDFEKTKDSKIETEISLLDTMQMAIKIFLNSLYGAMANKYFRLFNPNVAESITVTGQLTVQWAAHILNTFINKMLKNKVFKDYIIASDTDSVYINCEDIVRSVFATDDDKMKICDFLDKVAKSLETQLDQGFGTLANYLNASRQEMIMKREIIADKAIWTAKKRYMANVLDSEGVRYKEPKLKIVGIEAVRSSTPAVIRDWFEDFFSIVLNTDEKTAQQKIAEYRKDFKALPVEAIAFPRGVSELEKYSDRSNIYGKGTPIHVRGALLYNHYLKQVKSDFRYDEIKVDDKMRFVYLSIPNPIQENVIGFSGILPKEFNLHKYIDYDLQFEKCFIDPINIVFNAINWSVEERATLEGFFS